MISAPRRWAAALGVVLLLAGCGAATTAIGKRDLEVQTKTTNTIFLDPVGPDRRTVFVQVRNTSDKPDLDVERAVREQIAAHGYRIVEDPDQAHYLLQANVLQAGRSSRTAAEQTFGGGFGSAIFGGAVGAAAGRALSRDTGTIIAGGLLGAAASAAADSMVKDVTYTVTADVQVSERAREGVTVTESLKQNLDQGSAGNRVVSSTETHGWKRYQTRIQAIANQANLEFEDAAPDLIAGLTRSISGIF